MNGVALSNYLFLAIAIVAEVVATSALGRSESFTRWLPSLIAVFGYALSFWCLSFPLRVLPAGVVYAIWSGVGIVLVASSARVLFGQRLDPPALLGLGFIVAGVVIINLFSRASMH